MKFILFVEGHTEDKALPAFLKRWLDPRLESPVGIQTVRFDGWPELFELSSYLVYGQRKRRGVSCRLG